MMKKSHLIVHYLLGCCFIAIFCPLAHGGEYDYGKTESKHYGYDYHPAPPKKAQVDINIPIDFGTIAKLGVIGLTQLKLLLALGKVAGAGLGVGALGLGSLGKLALSVGPVHKGGGLSIDVGPNHAKSHAHHHYVEEQEEEEHHHYVPEKYHYRASRGKY